MKDNVHRDYQYGDESLLKMMQMVSQSNLLFYLVDVNQFEHLAEMKRIATAFASRIDIIDMNNIPLKCTIELMKALGEIQQKIVDFIKNADLYMDGFEYTDMDKVCINLDSEVEKPEERALAGYIIEGIEQGRILVVDELDNSLHFKLTRAID